MGDSKLGSGRGYPRVTPIGPEMRVLFAILGIAALVAIALIASNELRAMSSTSFVGPLVMLAFCAVVLIGAVLLLQSAVRGTATVRRPSGRR